MHKKALLTNVQCAIVSSAVRCARVLLASALLGALLDWRYSLWREGRLCDWRDCARDLLCLRQLRVAEHSAIERVFLTAPVAQRCRDRRQLDGARIIICKLVHNFLRLCTRQVKIAPERLEYARERQREDRNSLRALTHDRRLHDRRLHDRGALLGALLAVALGGALDCSRHVSHRFH